MAAGVFFKDWNRVVFGDSSAFGIMDAPGKDFGMAAGKVSNVEPVLKLSAVAFAVMPKSKDAIAVDGTNYTVQSSSPIDDGAMVEIRLRVA